MTIIKKKHRGTGLKQYSAGGSSVYSGGENYYDDYLARLSREVSVACDKFWTMTEERRYINEKHYKSTSFYREEYAKDQ